MKYIKTYEEIKYTPEHKKLIQQVRYRLNKYFGRNCCGVAKHRGDFKKHYNSMFPKYIQYTGSTMLFDINLPSLVVSQGINNYDEKIKNFQKFAKKLGLNGRYETIDTDYVATEEQMKEIISQSRYIDLLSDVEKYNL